MLEISLFVVIFQGGLPLNWILSLSFHPNLMETIYRYPLAAIFLLFCNRIRLFKNGALLPWPAYFWGRKQYTYIPDENIHRILGQGNESAQFKYHTPGRGKRRSTLFPHREWHYVEIFESALGKEIFHNFHLGQEDYKDLGLLCTTYSFEQVKSLGRAAYIPPVSGEVLFLSSSRFAHNIFLSFISIHIPLQYAVSVLYFHRYHASILHK